MKISPVTECQTSKSPGNTQIAKQSSPKAKKTKLHEKSQSLMQKLHVSWSKKNKFLKKLKSNV